jgi:hypothetical protein
VATVKLQEMFKKKINGKSLDEVNVVSLIGSTELSLFFNRFNEQIDAFVPFWNEFQYFVSKHKSGSCIRKHARSAAS